MTSEKRYWWRVALELKLRKSYGDAFQDFFSLVMAKAHGSDFVRVHPFGQLGDKGCDGYLQSSGRVFQCYGALNAEQDKVAYLVGKMKTDHAKAAKELGSLMKEWNMVHNLIDGLPIEAVQVLDALKKGNPKQEFAFFGVESFEEIIFSLDEQKIEDLLGIAATALDGLSLQTAELRDLVNSVALALDETDGTIASIQPVPTDKLKFNKLPNPWVKLIEFGWSNAYLVADYLSKRPEPLFAEQLAEHFRNRYAYLKSQALTPSAIMSSLYEMVVGSGNVTAPRQVAAQALLAFLFESCDIFEDHPSMVIR
jgi:hypothetical protein